MRSWLQIGLMSVLAVAAAGCFETKQVVTLNPDGSGKIVVDTLMDAKGMMGMMGGDNKAPDANDVARKMAVDMVHKSTGVDAWSGVSSEVAKDGRLRVVGTAYFPDYAKLKLEGPGKLDIKWTADGKDMVLEMVMDKKGEDAPKVEPKPLSDEEAAAELKKKREEYNKSKPMMTSFLSTLKMDSTFVLPGKVAEVNVFEKTDGGVRLVIEGKKMLDAMDKMMADDKLMLEALKAGKDPVKDGPGASDAYQEMMFGKKGAIRAKVTDVKPVFDYKAEMEKAKAAQPAMMKTLGADEAASPKTGLINSSPMPMQKAE